MRITVHLDTFASTDPAAYAILWIDTTEHRWSREGHAGVELPAWGNVVCRGGTTRVTGADDPHSLCVLEGLDLGAKQGPFEGETGAAHWYPHAHRAPVVGAWHVQCIDETVAPAEHELFTGREAS
ncbi:Protein of uncharacterised function (DUF3564) [Burkholderia pseudomallei]|uniref:DUF3564 domain-containing protein n=1 Tax=Burkholderia pseudomallei (strain 1026b) TaxID=884204 RepID=A0A0H3I1N8_BURP2|nr:hypothetical protein BP1026B_II2060 [Burkholderia pseudomallei 1026b]AIO98818.1 hypothetical protein DP50_4332 [Burkholderia pseudomallei 576]AIP16072.1 hypothetical protein DP60_4683 [Burkholderia pseudomallei]AIV81523.1 hypothetical protein X978_5666 [Burkholderia pseudomallei MSHR3965]AIV88566.1 hypothetical protein X995_5471 [Burkholderia pseudomallei B03]AIV94398.1 hypothetical protein X996_5613 [Burkholderia pseudomallei A79A]AJX25033.1 hypothetical protein AQ15_4495 [Burkholderia ps